MPGRLKPSEQKETMLCALDSSKHQLIEALTSTTHKQRIYESEIRRLQRKPKTYNCAIYARVSSRKQTALGNIERQKERLIEYAKNKGYCLKKVFCETASGINENRTKLKKLLSMVANHEIDIILIEFKDREEENVFGDKNPQNQDSKPQ